MGWQLPLEHVDALKHPLRAFQNTELKRAQLLADPTGKPLSRRGKLCEVYQARAHNGLERWAIKCYREETSGLDHHYRALSEYLLNVDLPYLVPFQFVEHGLAVRGHSYPLVKMGWADGIPLNVFVGENADHPSALHRLAELWLRLAADLRKANIAHGCLQHEHVFIDRQGRHGLLVRLVDYDALYVPALAGSPPLEMGHANYEHPQRLWQRIHNAESDRFPHLVIYTALMCVAAGGRVLWERHDTGDNLLFKERDFQDPANSALFRELWQLPDPEVHALVVHLVMAAQGNGREVPSLEWLAAEARTAGKADPNSEVEKRAKALLFGERTGPASPAAPPRASNQTFGVLVEDGDTGTSCATQHDDNFDLIVEDEGHAPWPSAPPPLPVAASAPPPLPVAAPAPPAPPPLPVAPALPMVAGSFFDDPYTATYHLEAWMPEKVAVMKVQGFVDAATGEVVTSVPGLMRVQLLDPLDLVSQSKSGLLTWLGLVDQTRAEPRVLAVLDFHMRHKETNFQKLLDITLEIRPGQDPPPVEKWRRYCNKLYCDVRAFLMGLQQ